MNYGTSGVGSPSNMSGELLKVLTRVEYTHVPYKGQALAVSDLVGGQIHFAFPSIPASVGHIRSGRLRALVVSSEQRAPALPDVPTMAQAGVKEEFPQTWWALAAPKGTPLSRPDSRLVASRSDPQYPTGRCPERGLLLRPLGLRCRGAGGGDGAAPR